MTKIIFLLITSELKFASSYSLEVNGYNTFSHQNVKNLTQSSVHIFKDVFANTRFSEVHAHTIWHYTLAVSFIISLIRDKNVTTQNLALLSYWYKKNFCKCTFNRYSVITQFAKLAAGEQLCLRFTHSKIIALQNL